MTVQKGTISFILVPSALAAIGGAIGAASSDKHPVVGAAVGGAVFMGVLAAYAAVFAGGFADEKPKTVGTSGAPHRLDFSADIPCASSQHITAGGFP